MKLARRTRLAAVVLIPMMAVAIWAGSAEPPLVWSEVRSMDSGLTPADPPLDHEPSEFSPAVALEQAGRLRWPLLGFAALVVVGLAAGCSRLVRRAHMSRRVRNLALRGGLLALLFGIAASAILVAGDEIVSRELGDRGREVTSDRASTPWGSTGVALAGTALGLLGCLETWMFHLFDRMRGRSSTSPRGDLS